MVDSQPVSICLTFDFDAFSVWPAAFGQTTPTPLSRGEFGARVGVPRILDLLAREQVKATFFTPGHTIDSFPELACRILDEGHEIGHHGYLHEGPAALAEADERAVLEKGLQAMATRLAGYVPSGYRSPSWDLSHNTTRLLSEYGFTYDSSMMAQDFEPYWCRTGDRCPLDRGFEFGEEIALVELPVSWSLDDFPQLEHIVAPPILGPASASHAALLTQWLADLEFADEELDGGVFTMTFHPEAVGRGARIRMVEAMIAKGKELGARFLTGREATAAWASAARQPGSSR
jgi:peptidoglycan-N-acetylglucosamine deacetylase